MKLPSSSRLVGILIEGLALTHEVLRKAEAQGLSVKTVRRYLDGQYVPPVTAATLERVIAQTFLPDQLLRSLGAVDSAAPEQLWRTAFADALADWRRVWDDARAQDGGEVDLKQGGDPRRHLLLGWLSADFVVRAMLFALTVGETKAEPSERKADAAGFLNSYLRWRMKALDVTQEEFADRLGAGRDKWPEGAVRKWVRGALPHAAQLEALARATAEQPEDAPRELMKLRGLRAVDELLRRLKKIGNAAWSPAQLGANALCELYLKERAAMRLDLTPNRRKGLTLVLAHPQPYGLYKASRQTPEEQQRARDDVQLKVTGSPETLANIQIFVDGRQPASPFQVQIQAIRRRSFVTLDPLESVSVIQQVESALRQFPDAPPRERAAGYTTLGWAHARIALAGSAPDSNRLAIMCFSKSLELDPDQGGTHASMAETLWEMGPRHRSRAHKHVRHAVALGCVGWSRGIQDWIDSHRGPGP